MVFTPSFLSWLSLGSSSSCSRGSSAAHKAPSPVEFGGNQDGFQFPLIHLPLIYGSSATAPEQPQHLSSEGRTLGRRQGRFPGWNQGHKLGTWARAMCCIKEMRGVMHSVKTRAWQQSTYLGRGEKRCYRAIKKVRSLFRSGIKYLGESPTKTRNEPFIFRICHRTAIMSGRLEPVGSGSLLIHGHA